MDVGTRPPVSAECGTATSAWVSRGWAVDTEPTQGPVGKVTR